MTALQRHDLVWLDGAAWRDVLAGAGPQALDCLAHWPAHELPLVVTRQGPGWRGSAAHEPLRLGLGAPLRWGRQRVCVQTRLGAVARRGGFPPAREALPGAAWQELCAALQQLGVAPRVYGSHGWQIVSGLPCTHAQSDVDLLLAADGPEHADSVVALLHSAPHALPRIDGEIVFDDGGAVAWREWAAWRAGHARQLLVKRLHGAALEAPAAWRRAAFQA